MKLIYGLLLILLLPIVDAQSLGSTTIQPLRVLDQTSHTVVSNDVSSTIYQFVFPVPPWNMTYAGHTQLNSLGALDVLTTIDESSQSDHNIEYNTTYVYNGSHSFAINERYTRTPATLFGIQILGRYFWVKDTGFFVDGAEQCHDTYHDFSIYGWSATYQTKGSSHFTFGRVANLSGFSTNNVGNFFSNGTGANIGPGINTAYPLQCFQGGILSGGGGTFSVKAGSAWNLTDLQSPVLMYANVSDTRLYSNTLVYSANSEINVESQLAQTIAANTAPNCIGFFEFIANCINPLTLIGSMLSWTSDIITNLLSNFGNAGGTIASIVTYPLKIFIDILDFISIVFLNTTSTHGVSGGFWMILLWLSSMGFLLDGIFGFKGYFLTLPGFFAYGAFLSIIYGAYFIFWLVPRAAVDIGSRILTAITNLVP